MRRSPRAVLAWCMTGLLAVATARSVATDLAQLHRQARRSGPLVSVVVAAHDIDVGATVRRRDLDRHRLFAADRFAGMLTDPDAAVGKVAATPLLAGIPIVARQLERDGGGVVPTGTRAVRIPTADSLTPAPGNVVDVLATLAGGNEPTVAVARGALVIAGGGDGGALVVVAEAAAARIAYALANGTVTMVLAPRSTACCAASGT